MGRDPAVFAYLREAESERLLVALNFSRGPATWSGPGPGWPDSGRLALSTDPDRRAGTVSLAPLALGPDEGVVIVL